MYQINSYLSSVGGVKGRDFLPNQKKSVVGKFLKS